MSKHRHHRHQSHHRWHKNDKEKKHKSHKEEGGKGKPTESNQQVAPVCNLLILICSFIYMYFWPFVVRSIVSIMDHHAISQNKTDFSHSFLWLALKVANHYVTVKLNVCPSVCLSRARGCLQVPNILLPVCCYATTAHFQNIGRLGLYFYNLSLKTCICIQFSKAISTV